MSQLPFSDSVNCQRCTGANCFILHKKTMVNHAKLDKGDEMDEYEDKEDGGGMGNSDSGGESD